MLLWVVMTMCCVRIIYLIGHTWVYGTFLSLPVTIGRRRKMDAPEIPQEKHQDNIDTPVFVVWLAFVILANIGLNERMISWSVNADQKKKLLSSRNLIYSATFAIAIFFTRFDFYVPALIVASFPLFWVMWLVTPYDDLGRSLVLPWKVVKAIQKGNREEVCQYFGSSGMINILV